MASGSKLFCLGDVVLKVWYGRIGKLTWVDRPIPQSVQLLANVRIAHSTACTDPTVLSQLKVSHFMDRQLKLKNTCNYLFFR